MNQFSWARRDPKGYEVSSKGDTTFSAFSAIMPDGRSIEQWYQCDVKGYEPGGTNWRLGKGNPPLYIWKKEELWGMYLSLWQLWALHHIDHLEQLAATLRRTNRLVLTDCFASTDINQARAIATILNEWF